MTPRQLALAPDPLPERLRDSVYLGFAFSPKDAPGESCQRAIERYERRRGRLPRTLICHAEYAQVVGAEVNGIPVFGDGRARHVVLLGPMEV